MGTHLGLNLPEQGPRPANAFDIRPKRVEQWLSELPMANVGETARQIFGVLTETNRYNLPAQDRLRLLETLREPVHYLTEAFKKHFVGISFPLPGKNRQIAALTREIYTEMATGYKTALEDSLARTGLFRDTKTLALLAHRAITYLGRILLTVYQVYAPVPGGLWRELHTLYRFAEEHKLATTAITDNQHRQLPKSTLASEYKRLLLLSLTSPYRLRQGEVEKVYVNLERWVGHCRLGSLNHNDKQSGHFVIVLNADYPPRYTTASQQTQHPEYCRSLNNDELARIIREQIMRNSEETLTTLTGIDIQTPTLSSDLMRRLMLTWGMSPKRSYSRVVKRDRVQVALGLRAAHHFILASHGHNHPEAHDAAGAGNDKPFNQPAHYRSQTVKDINETQPDVWDMIYPHEVTAFEPLRDSEPAQPLPFDSPHSKEYQTQTWKLINESAGGCCLVNPGREQANVLVGELIAIHHVDAPEPDTWSIGIIRWMKTDDTEGLHLGIQMLTPSAEAGGIKPASHPKQNNYQRCLLLPALDGIGQPATLVLPPVPYREGNKLLLQVAGRESPIALTKMVENTGLFAQFQFNSLEPPAQKKNGPDSASEHDFSNLWSSL